MSTLAPRLFILGACLLAIGLFARAPVERRTRDARIVLPRPELIKALGRSHMQLVADYFWLRSINRSVIVLDESEGQALLGLGNLIADLDPKFLYNYWLSGLNAPVPPPERTQVWANAREAADLMRRGLAVAPTYDKLVVVLAANLIFNQHDLIGAAKVLQERLRYPGGLTHWPALITRLLAAGGEFDASREFAQTMLDAAGDDATHKVFEERLKLIDLEEVLARVDAAVQRYQAEHGIPPSLTTRELVDAGYLDAEPVDPFGGLIVIKQGRAYSTAAHERLEVYGRDSD